MATEKRYIDANELVRKINKFDVFYFTGETDIQIHDCQMVELGRVLAEIDEQQTVDAVEMVHGRWVLTVHEEQCNFRWNVTAECSECKHSKGEIYAGYFSGFPKVLVEGMLPLYAKRVKLDNYCPNCGADMRERKYNG